MRRTVKVPRLHGMGATLLALAALSQAAQAQTISWCVTATGGQGGINLPGIAYGTVVLDTSNNFLTWDIAIKDLSSTQTAAHLHTDSMGGAVEVDLGGGNPLTGMAPLTAAQAADLIGGHWFVNIHSTNFPSGEISGQVDEICTATLWSVFASGAEEVPSTGSGAVATGMIHLEGANGQLSWNLVHQGLSGNHTGTHLHGPAPVGSNAGVQLNLGTGNPLTGAVTGFTFINSTQALQLLCGLWYVNYHTSNFPSGEIRGQVDDLSVDAYCSGLPNSFSEDGARLITIGDFVVANNNLEFRAHGVPPGKFGYLLIGQGTARANPPGSSGTICLGGAPIGRYRNQVLTADNNGGLGPFTPDILNVPNPLGGMVMAGQTWNFQAWFRDGATNNFTDALAVTFE